MDIYVVYNEIVEKLKASDHRDILSELENAAAGAATGSEALMIMGLYLANLKSKH